MSSPLLSLPAGDFSLPSCPSDTIAQLRFNPATNAPQASLLLSVAWSNDALIHFVTPSGGELKAHIQHSAPLLCCCWTCDGSAALVGAGDATVKLWELNKNQLISIGRHAAPVRGVCYSSEMNFIASGSWDNTVAYWDPRASAIPAASVNVGERIYAMDLSGHYLAIGTSNRKFAVFDVRKPTVYFLSPFDSPMKFQTRCLALMTANQEGFVAGSIEGRACVQYMHAADEPKNFAFRCHRESAPQTIVYAVNSVAFNPTAGSFATAGADGSYQIWDHSVRSRVTSSIKVGNSITSLSYNSSGTLLAYAVGYDWSQGAEPFEQRKVPRAIAIHTLTAPESKRINI